jgi:hypothetical protein
MDRAKQKEEAAKKIDLVLEKKGREEEEREEEEEGAETSLQKRALMSYQPCHLPSFTPHILDERSLSPPCGPY